MCTARMSADDGEALFECPTIWDSGRKGTGTGMGRGRRENTNVSGYALTSATNCSLRSSSDGNPTSGPSVWGRVRRTKVQLAGPQNRYEPKKKVTPTFKGVCSSQSIFGRRASSGFNGASFCISSSRGRPVGRRNLVQRVIVMLTEREQ